MDKLFTVYNRRTDELVAFELPIEKCIDLMGVAKHTFYQAKSNANKGKNTKWEIFEADNKEEK